MPCLSENIPLHRSASPHLLTHAKEGHDIEKCDDCKHQQWHLTPSRGKSQRNQRSDISVTQSTSGTVTWKACEEKLIIGHHNGEPEEAVSLTGSNCMISGQADHAISAVPIADQDSRPDDAMDVNGADFLPTAQELNHESVDDFEERDAAAPPKVDSASICTKRKKTNLSRTTLHAIREKRSSPAGMEERIPMPKKRSRRFWCKVLGCQLIFGNESHRDHHSQHHSQQVSDKRKQKAHAKEGHDVRTFDDCTHQQLHLTASRREGTRMPAAATAVRLDQRPKLVEDSDNGSEPSERAQRNQSPHVCETECSSSSGSNFNESGRTGAAEAEPNRHPRSFNWDKRCHVCCKEFVLEINLRLHMLSHREGGHDMDRCEYCRIYFSWHKKTGCRSHASLNSDNKQHGIEQRVEDQHGDDAGNGESGTKENEKNGCGVGDSNSRSPLDSDDGVSTNPADEEDVATAIGSIQKMIDECTKICRQVRNHASSARNGETGSSNTDINDQQAASGEADQLVSGSHLEVGESSGVVWHDDVQEQGSAECNEQAVHQSEEAEVVEVSDDEDMSMPLITITN